MRLVLIDGHAILHRAYHALPPLTTSKGELVNAVFGFVSMLLRVISDLRPSHLVVAFDRPKPTFRKKLFTGYQAKRPKMDEELVPQIAIVHKVLERMGVPIFEMDGYEADDVIGTITAYVEKLKTQNSLRLRDVPYGTSLRSVQAKLKTTTQRSKTDEEIETIIVTGDRDILQLINEKTKVYMPVKGLSESKLYGEKEVEEKFGVKPAQMIDYKALVGDQSDNYPGVSGIGSKTASSLLSCFETLEQIYKRLDEVKSDSLKGKLKEGEESAEMAKKLATIVTNVPIEVNWEKCKLKNLDRPDVHHLFEELEFRSLIPRLSTRNIEQPFDFAQGKRTKNKKQKKEKEKQKDNNNQQIQLF